LSCSSKRSNSSSAGFSLLYRLPAIREPYRDLMTSFMTDPAQQASNWDAYWRGVGDAAAYAAGGVSHHAILAFWESFFRAATTQFPAAKMIDIASGDGAVIACALDAFAGTQADITCLDVSAAAVQGVRDRFPAVRGVVSDARSIPLPDAAFDIVTSQFGVEYAGLDAIDEASRLLARGGRLALLLHSTAGMMHRECGQSLDAISRLRESAFIPLAIDMLAAAFEAARGADRAAYESAAKRLAPAVNALESIMREYGQHVAGDTIARLYSDVDLIHRNIRRYEPGEVLGWLHRMDAELVDYAGRMSSMCDAAIDQAAFDSVCQGLQSRGHTLLQAETVQVPEHGLPLAWKLVTTI
jgi:ubiquinone/menaquinone biosynthesis C-methylase UbiE